ncbi:hypothetical protein F4860DRAFT_102910 [Xylaria cubensis]|nr:hypothetical protein F4860DRAFT_102910 [Xylaria cubensis]
MSNQPHQSHQSGSTPHDARSIFRRACSGFRESLSDDHRLLFTEYESSTAMLRAMREQIATKDDDANILSRCCNRIKRLSERLSPFFRVVDIFVSSNPQYAAIAWGAIRLIFLLASNHVEFVESIGDMLEKMGSRLPIYESFIEELTQRPDEPQRPNINTPFRLGEAACGRLRRALAYIYSDLIQFCFDICVLFSRQKSKFRLKFPGSFLSSCWKPFDTRFATLIKRWDEHKQIIELELHASSALHQLHTNTVVEEKLRSIEEGYLQARDERHKENITRELYSWIYSPCWLDPFEDAQDRRAKDSTGWFVNHTTVHDWINKQPPPSGNRFHVLHVIAKPGYGKTTLCTSLVETVQRRFGIRAPNSHPPSCKIFLSYFYFDTRRQDSINSTAAWRAVLMQILHAFPSDLDIIDASLVLRALPSSGQQVASKKEIIAMLKLVVARFNHLYLIFDGVDECIDHDQFLNTLTELCEEVKVVSIALFSRPTLCVPQRLAENTVRLPLETQQNLEDIKRFLRPTIASIADGSLFLSYRSVEDFVTSLANRANGMFLWAKLFLDYIQSPNLSPRQKQDAIQNMNRFEGLDRLFSAILRSLACNNTHSARVNITKTLKMTAYAHRPMHVDELMYAIAMPLDRMVELGDTIPDFAENLGRLSGVLLELDSRRYVQFVHLSALEYTTDSMERLKDVSRASELVIDRASSGRCLASASLSYLYYTVQAGPLSGSRNVVPDVRSEARRLPFLDYAVKSWSGHVLDYLDQAENFPNDMEDEILIQLASKFLSQKASVMTWIEASWMFKRAPQIRNGRSDRSLQKYIDTSFSAGTHISIIDMAYRSLATLSRDLGKLNSSWDHILVNEPNEIWEPSISAFNTSSF